MGAGDQIGEGGVSRRRVSLKNATREQLVEDVRELHRVHGEMTTKMALADQRATDATHSMMAMRIAKENAEQAIRGLRDELAEAKRRGAQDADTVKALVKLVNR